MKGRNKEREREQCGGWGGRPIRVVRKGAQEKPEVPVLTELGNAAAVLSKRASPLALSVLLLR